MESEKILQSTSLVRLANPAHETFGHRNIDHDKRGWRLEPIVQNGRYGGD